MSQNLFAKIRITLKVILAYMLAKLPIIRYAD